MSATQSPGRSKKLHGNSSGLPAMLTMGEVAEATGMSTATIRRRIADGTLTAHRIGPRHIRVERDSVTRLLGPIGGAA